MGVMLWFVLFVALTGTQFGYGLPVRSTPQTYPQDASGSPALEGWSSNGLYALPVLALLITAITVLFGCTWCYRHKDCKLFAASATHLHDRQSHPPDSGFSEPVNNNVSEDNNNGPISLREMQNIANNNAAAYIVSENEERNRISRESVVEFEPLPAGIRVTDPLERCADWFGSDDFPRNRLQYLREIGRGWFGRVVEGEIEDGAGTSTVAVRILNQNASLEDKARFLNEAKIYRDIRHENVLALIARCLQEDPWIILFELCNMDLQQYLIVNRPKMAILNESGVPLRFMCDVSSALAYLHSRGCLYRNLWSGNILVRGDAEAARAIIGTYTETEPHHDFYAPELRRHPPLHTTSSDVWSLGVVVWEVCTWGAVPSHHPPPVPDLPCPYRNHLYQVMQLCWNHSPENRPTSTQVHALINHLHTTHTHASDASHDDGYGSSDFEERWQKLKPNSIPKIDEHVAMVHAPSTSMTSHFTGSDQELDTTQRIQDTLSVDMDTAVSRSSSIMSDRDPLSVQMKSESLTNLHGSLEDVRNIYLTHNEMAVLECHQANTCLDDMREKEHDRSDSSVDPWLKDIIAGSQDDVSYYKDVSDVIKNLDNILNSEKTSSSESSHQASPSRDNLNLECKKDCPVQSSLVKSPGISNFQNFLDTGYETKQESEPCEEEDIDRDTTGTLSHSFERHSNTTSQHTLANLTPDTPIKNLEVSNSIKPTESINEDVEKIEVKINEEKDFPSEVIALPKDNLIDSDRIPKLKELCVTAISSISEIKTENLNLREDCQLSCDNYLTENVRTDEVIETKSVEKIFIKSKEEIITDSISGNTKSDKGVKTVDQCKPKCGLDTVAKIDSGDLTDDTKQIEHKATPTEEIKAVELQKGEFLLDDVNTDSKGTDDNVVPVNESHELNIDVTKNEPIVYAKLPTINEPKLIENIEEINTSDVLVIKDTLLPPVIDNVKSIVNSFLESEIALAQSICVIKSVEQEHKHLRLVNFSNGKDVIPELESSDKQKNIAKYDNKPSEIKINKTQDAEVTELKDQIEHSNDNSSPKCIKSGLDVMKSDVLSDVLKEGKTIVQSNDSTAYMHLINSSNKQIKDIFDDDIKTVQSSLDLSNSNYISPLKNESTIYLDLPETITDTYNFSHSEKIINSQNIFKNILSTSTPKGTDSSADVTLDNSMKNNEIGEAHVAKSFSEETKVLEYGPGLTLMKQEQKYATDNITPFESPTKSTDHHTDTYDENSSVVLGPFENYALELFKGMKSTEPVDLPKEELLAFSSNFSEMNLETPSPLRDGNFLNEVPDIAHDDLQFDDIDTISEAKPSTEVKTDDTDETDCQSFTEKHVSPSTPPNSPGNFLASTSQQKYLVDIDLNKTNDFMSVETSNSQNSTQKEIDINQIELQITSKLAIAENENNMNIEYSGPLTVEEITIECPEQREDDTLPESFLAGNGGSVENMSDGFTLDEECVKALRNELELKLPLAQVAAIEPQCEIENEWSTELPPPPELIVNYPGALSPIAEETGQQLSAYENDTNWNLSIRTESSESYPEPCNNSTDEVTDLLTGAPSGPHDNETYTIRSKDHSVNNTYTVQKDATTSKEITMSVDSLNASPLKKQIETKPSIDDKTYNKNDDEKEFNCERISQESPFLLSPTTDTSMPNNSDNVTGMSTLSKTSIPTDAKLSKPTETQCLSKATSIDSWCSNDTLYNVEENFDDLAMDSDLPDFEPERAKEEENSDTSQTLTHNDDEKELSHCSTYIIHDSKSEPCETFSRDSITANDNCTYTKAKTEAAGTSPSVITKSEVNDSTKNTQTKDLAYGTLMSGLPSYSNCTTEVVSGTDDPWKLPQPELVRKSPLGNDVNLSPPTLIEREFSDEQDIPKIETAPTFKTMESVEIFCLQDVLDSQNKSENVDQLIPIEVNDSPNYLYKDMAPSLTSTPLSELTDNDYLQPTTLQLPQIKTEKNTECSSIQNDIPTFQTFLYSAELRPQDISPNTSNETTHQDTKALLKSSVTSSGICESKDLTINEPTPTYSNFERSAETRFQEVNSTVKCSRDLESRITSHEFRQFENSVKNRPQDLSSLIDASSLLLKSERWSSELLMGSSINFDQTSQSGNRMNKEPIRSRNLSPPITTNLQESHFNDNESHARIGRENIFITDLDEEETDQPHSIIITENFNSFRNTPNKTYDSHQNYTDLNHTYNSHENRSNKYANDVDELGTPNFNGTGDDEFSVEKKSPKNDDIEKFEPKDSDRETSENHRDNCNLPRKQTTDTEEVKCNGSSEHYATENVLNLTFEELIESNVDDSDIRDKEIVQLPVEEQSKENHTETDKSLKSPVGNKTTETSKEIAEDIKTEVNTNDVENEEKKNIALLTESFLQNEKKFCQLDVYIPLLNDIRFTGPASEIMSTSFTQESPTETLPPEDEKETKTDIKADIIKEWDSDSDSHSSNSSSGEFIWKQRESDSQPAEGNDVGDAENGSECSGESGSGSEGDEVEFVPSSWDCRAAPAKSSLRSLEQTTPDIKKRVVFKREKYHCVYEYPREVVSVDSDSPANYLPDFSTYSEWDPASVEDTDIGYGQLFGSPNQIDLYPLRSGISFSTDYDEDFFISSSARPFESLGVMSTTSQFFPGKHAKQSLVDRDIDDLVEDFPPPPSPLPPLPQLQHTPLLQTRTPSLDFTTPDSGVEDITPGSTTTEEDLKTRKLPESDMLCWRQVDSTSSSESVSPSSPGGEALGGLRHTRDKLKLDLPPSPHIPSPRHNRVFSFVVEKSKRHRPVQDEIPSEVGSTPLVMTDGTPIVTTSLPLQKECEDVPVPEPTFSTFGKSLQQKENPEHKNMILTDAVEDPEQREEPVEREESEQIEQSEQREEDISQVNVVETVKGEGTVLDSGDEDSGIESSSKATLERNKTPNIS